MRRRDGQLLTPERRAFALEVGFDPERVAFMGAVHGAAVANVDKPGLYDDVDGLVTDRPGVALFATYADCYPVLLLDPKRGAAGLGHAGWRGTRAGISGALVEALSYHFGSAPDDLVAGIGPGVCADCYEVSAEVGARFPTEVRRASGDRWLLDLALANRRQLEAAGVPAKQIHVHGACTRESADLPSHRRSPDGARFGCLLALR